MSRDSRPQRLKPQTQKASNGTAKARALLPAEAKANTPAPGLATNHEKERELKAATNTQMVRLGLPRKLSRGGARHDKR